MAKRKDEDAYQIPIEDASDEQATEGASDEAGSTEPASEKAETESVPANDKAADGTAETTDETAKTADETAKAADEAAATEAEEVDAEVLEGDPDIVAEAEAVVEGAVADTLEAIQVKAQEWQDRYLRLHAEWDTYRRRTQEQRADEKVRATEKLMENLLPVLDDFERTVAYAEENGETGLLEGVKAVQTKLIDALTKSGLEVIDPAGEPYNALEAQAVQMVPDEEAFDETVKDVYQKGYKMGKKVLRSAMVTVTTGGPKRPKEDEGSEEK